jgi:hypothetical protein
VRAKNKRLVIRPRALLPGRGNSGPALVGQFVGDGAFRDERQYVPGFAMYFQPL